MLMLGLMIFIVIIIVICYLINRIIINHQVDADVGHDDYHY